MKPPRILYIFSLVPCAALAFASVARAYIENDPGAVLAPSAQPHSIYFATSGLAEGISITISGEHTNKKGNSIPFKKSFESPGPSQPIKTKPGSMVTQMDGYPEQYLLGDTIYTLIDIAPSSPFTAGLSGDSTIVVGTYISCTLPLITGQPISATVMVGESISLTATLAEQASVSIQWYKDGLEISGATGSQYAIESARASDAGIYHLVVSNSCGMVQSDPAELIVSKLSQTIDFPQPASPVVFDTSFTVSPTATSGLTVTVQAAGGCQIAGDLVTMTSGSRDCSLTASQPGDDDYLPAAQVERLVAAAKEDQYIDFPPPPEFAFEGLTFSVYPITDSGLAVDLAAMGSCTATGYAVTIISPPGVCILIASQAGNENYNPAEPITHTLQTLPPANKTYSPIIYFH